MAAGGSSSAVVPAFDPDKYRPLPHEFEPVGLKLYQQKSRKINKHRKKKARILDNEAVPQEPEIHFSVKNKEVKKTLKVFKLNLVQCVCVIMTVTFVPRTRNAIRFGRN